ncbi:MAG: hypothetical protein NT104_04715 [Bacteroidetes bacterium]|nr:hypothetical protein [Bacteroidota bacterium]
MKFGIRTPSLTKSIAARTSIKRVVRHNLGLKAPRGFGWFTNPKKALYNRVYNRTTFSVWKGFKFLTLFGVKSSMSNYQTLENDNRNSINIVGIIANILALFIIGSLFIGLYNQAIDHYGSYFWTHGGKSDGKLGSGFTSIIMILILLGVGRNLLWVTLIFFGYVCYFFIEYYQVLLINIPLAYVIIMTALGKLGFSSPKPVDNKDLISTEKSSIDEHKVDELVDEYRRLRS